MHYQNLLCLGDSQTFGARSYGCYPLYLAQSLSARTPYEWRAINRSQNGFTARDLWFKLNDEIDGIRDTYQACLLIGTNDVGNGTDPQLFAEYYRQILRALRIGGYKAIVCGLIPPIYADGHIFFTRRAAERRDSYNELVRQVVAETERAHLADLDGLGRDCYVDPVHFNERGNRAAAAVFAEALLSL
ncbi:MAG TPA: SGNH/GDSL hydrolase family protein [Herpetosiphonaceae bacterium]